MKLNDIRPSVETSGDLKEEFFSIQDQGMIFDILRNKMYSNPILAICREISCNARDAHREVGTPDKPIEITLPSTLEPSYKIKDFGPGISPERMSNIFIKYAASTKRNDNIQTGGFGLGAKTPFSYSDTFSIVTNYNGIKYNYACFIDETKVGKLALLSKSDTTEPNGTEIIIPILEKDFKLFATETKNATQYWTIKPIIHGDLIYDNHKIILEGKKWAVIDYYKNYSSNNLHIIIDGIDYLMDNSIIFNAIKMELPLIKGSAVFYFDIGELNLSANREQIYLDEPTKLKLKNRFQEVKDEIKKSLIEKINLCQNLFDAQVTYLKLLKVCAIRGKFFENVCWNNIPLRNQAFFLEGHQVTSFHKEKNNKSFFLHRRFSGYLDPVENSELYFNDKNIQIRENHIKKCFENNPLLECLYVIHPKKLSSNKSIEEYNLLCNKFHLDKMNCKLLSTIVNVKSKKSTNSKLILFKYNTLSEFFSQSKYSDYQSDTNEKCLCLLTIDNNSSFNRYKVLINNRDISYEMRCIQSKFPKISFYAVNKDTSIEKIKEKFSDSLRIETFIEKILKEITPEKYFIHKELQERSDIITNINVANLSKSINNPKSFALRYIEHVEEYKKYMLGRMISLYEIMNPDVYDKYLKIKNTNDIQILKNNSLRFQMFEKYPMLRHIPIYGADNFLQDIAHYINIIDEKEKENAA